MNLLADLNLQLGKQYFYADASKIRKGMVVEFKKATVKVQMEGERHPRLLPRGKAEMLRTNLRAARKDQAERLQVRAAWYMKKAKELNEESVRLLESHE